MLTNKTESLLVTLTCRRTCRHPWARRCVRQYDGKVVPGTDPMGKEHFWFTATPPEETEKDTDHWAFNNGCASITPLRLDLTDEQAVECTLSNPPALSGLSPVLR